VMDGEDRPVDIADKAVAKNDLRDLPVPASTPIRQRIQVRDDRGCASGLIAQRLVGEPGQLHDGFSNGRHQVLPLGDSVSYQFAKHACVAQPAADLAVRGPSASRLVRRVIMPDQTCADQSDRVG
jgi:hypothetical protein